ncbi:hypothetical protein F5883DRAFT_700155 [Diaporthe sp. PMI_573]|nr:hypothetical protein F5883DRAFT_700155 [Diaporthaceae sp. PMI_573]
MFTPYKVSPHEMGPHWNMPASGRRQHGVLVCPSQFQFPGSYMVEVLKDSAAGSEAGGAHTRLTLFYFTYEELDESQLEEVRRVYGDFIPDYTFAGNMGLASENRELFVWRIDCAMGTPFLTDAAYFGLRRNCKEYANILRHYVDFVAAPLGPEGGGSINAQDWPEALHIPCIGAENILVRSDHSGIQVLWPASAAVRLPFGASLAILLLLEGTPLQVQEATDGCNDDKNPLTVRKVVDNSPFQSYSRDAYQIEILVLRHLQKKVPALAKDPKLWGHMFTAMEQGVEAATDITDGDKERYKTQVDRMRWDWDSRLCVSVQIQMEVD